MAKRATAVIGALWGDEGKGSIVHDVACSLGKSAIVCRYSGGANAGHTVVTDNGHRHVFSHFGAGSFAGVDSYLSKFFISNPMLWLKELNELNSKGVDPVLFVDQNSPITTPIDVAINQALEMARGMLRHGSCGVGINETVTRNEYRNTEYHANVSILTQPRRLREWLAFLLETYLPQRMDDLGLEELPHFIMKALTSWAALDAYCEASAAFCRRTRIDQLDVLDRYGHVIFEGSQGLLLDEYSNDFPNVTRARTGTHNVRFLSKAASIDNVDTIYVSRAYSTRHGNGPFDEVEGLRYGDATNMPNAWQGAMRFGHLVQDRLSNAIEADYLPDFAATRSIALTCIDQVGDWVTIETNRGKKRVPTDMLPELISTHTGLPIRSLSYGPSRQNIALRQSEAA